MDNILKQLYREFCFPIGIMTTLVTKNSGLLKVGDYRGCTMSSFRLLDNDICSFGIGKNRIMASALENTFAFHYLHPAQELLAKKFALNKLNCAEQFSEQSLQKVKDYAIFTDFHSLVLGKIEKKLEIGDGYLYIAKITYAETRNHNQVLHYTKNQYK